MLYQSAQDTGGDSLSPVIPGDNHSQVGNRWLQVADPAFAGGNHLLLLPQTKQFLSMNQFGIVGLQPFLVASQS